MRLHASYHYVAVCSLLLALPNTSRLQVYVLNGLMLWLLRFDKVVYTIKLDCCRQWALVCWQGLSLQGECTHACCCSCYSGSVWLGVRCC